jgi:hypothetical protein
MAEQDVENRRLREEAVAIINKVAENNAALGPQARLNIRDRCIMALATETNFFDELKYLATLVSVSMVGIGSVMVCDLKGAQENCSSGELERVREILRNHERLVPKKLNDRVLDDAEVNRCIIRLRNESRMVGVGVRG